MYQPACALKSPVCSVFDREAHQSGVKLTLHACRDPVLRTNVLQLIDQLLANKDTTRAFSGKAAQQLANEALLPALVWRAGKTAAAVRFAAITALSTLFAEHLLQPEQLQAMLEGDKLLPMLFQSLEEEYFVDTRLSACSASYHLLVPAGKLLTPEQRPLVYPELLKRLDDSSNAVRTSICAALQVFIASMEVSLEAAQMTYLLNGIVIHMDDIDPVIQEAVCQVLETAAASHPSAVHEVVAKVQHLHRSSTYINRVLAACKR